jgi:hypothetical protein
MKWIVGLALIVGINVVLMLWNEAPLISSGQTTDQWSRSCKYYFPVRVIERTLPLSQSCPGWAAPS